VAASTALLLVLLAQAAEPEFVEFGATPGQRVKLLRHPNAGVRARAAMLLAHAPPDEAIAGLLEALGDPASGVRFEVARTLGVMGDERAVPFLVRRLAGERTVRVTAALLYALARSGGGYVAHVVEGFLEHPSQQVRAAAAGALGALGDAGQRDALWSALRFAPEDPGFLVRAAALGAFVQLGWREDVVTAIEELERQGAHRHWAARAAILAAVGDAGLEDRLPWLESQLEDEPDPRVLAAGVGALGRFGRLDLVEARLEDERPEVRRAALVSLEAARHPRVAAIARAMVRGDPDTDVRFEAALVLARLDHEEADGYLVDALRSSNPVYWITALGVLEERHGKSFGRNPEAWTAFLRQPDR